MPQDLPNLLKHMTLAIYESGDAKGTSAERFVWALGVARRQLIRMGHMTASSEFVSLNEVALTVTGRALEMKHRREPATKSRRFDALYAKYGVALAEASKEGEAMKASGNDPEAVEEQAKQKKLRLKSWGK